MHVPSPILQLAQFASRDGLGFGIHSAAQMSERCNVAESDTEKPFEPKSDYDVINVNI